jgi:hypothetical protein
LKLCFLLSLRRARFMQLYGGSEAFVIRT